MADCFANCSVITADFCLFILAGKNLLLPNFFIPKPEFEYHTEVYLSWPGKPRIFVYLLWLQVYSEHMPFLMLFTFNTLTFLFSVAVLKWPAIDSLCSKTKKGKYEMLCVLFLLLFFFKMLILIVFFSV